MHGNLIYALASKTCSQRRKLQEDVRKNSAEKPRCRCSKTGIVLALLIISLSFFGYTKADYFSPAPPAKNLINQTFVSVALTTPATTVYINVTEYDAQQMVKNITIDFSEPITYVGLVIDVLKDKPLIINAPKTIPIIQYYDIRYLTELEDNITNVTIAFAIERATLQNMSIEENTLLHYQYNGSEFDPCLTRKIGENKTHLFIETETKVSPCFVITGSTIPAPLWSYILPIVAATFLAIVGVYVIRRYRLNHLGEPWRTQNGKQR
jgi:PGF-pre-PGF domain-containing protein